MSIGVLARERALQRMLDESRMEQVPPQQVRFMLRLAWAPAMVNVFHQRKRLRCSTVSMFRSRRRIGAREYGSVRDHANGLPPPAVHTDRGPAPQRPSPGNSASPSSCG